MSPTRKRAWLAVKTVAAVVLIAAVGRHFATQLGRGELASALHGLRYELLLPAGLLYIAAHTVWATFWVQLLRGQGATVTWPAGLRAYFVSQFGKYVPGKVAVLLLRVALLRHTGLSVTAVAVTGTYETLTSMAAGALIAVCLLPWTGPAVGLDPGSKVGFALAGLAGLPVAAGALHRLAARSLASPSPWLLARGLVQNAAGWLGLGLSLWLTVAAVTPAAPALSADVFLEDLGATALSYVAGFALLVAPGGLGAREEVLQLTLTPQLRAAAGADAQAAAMVVALVLRLVWTAAEVAFAGGLFWLARPGDRATPGPATTPAKDGQA